MKLTSIMIHWVAKSTQRAEVKKSEWNRALNTPSQDNQNHFSSQENQNTTLLNGFSNDSPAYNEKIDNIRKKAFTELISIGRSATIQVFST